MDTIKGNSENVWSFIIQIRTFHGAFGVLTKEPENPFFVFYFFGFPVLSSLGKNGFNLFRGHPLPIDAYYIQLSARYIQLNEVAFFYQRNGPTISRFGRTVTDAFPVVQE